MNAPPRVSVVIPTRNRAELLPRSVRSVLAQTVWNLELIIVDDASEDATPEVVADLARQDARVRPVRSERQLGLSGARNRGLREARAEFVAFNDDDDTWLPHKLERQLEAVQGESRVGVVYSPIYYVDGQGQEWEAGAMPVRPGEALRELLRRNFIRVPGVLVRRTLLERLGGFDERLPAYEDWEMWLRLAATTEFRYVGEPVARMFFTPGSLSTRRDAVSAASRRLVEQFRTRTPPLARAALADWYTALGHELIMCGASPFARELFRKAVQTDPLDPRRLAKAVLAHVGQPAYAAAVRLWERLAG